MYIVLWSDGIKIERESASAISQYLKEVYRSGLESPNLTYKVYREVRSEVIEKEVTVKLDGVAYE